MWDPIDSDRLYVGTQEGLYVLRLSGSTVLSTSRLLSGVAVRDLAVNSTVAPNDTRIWAATDQGLYNVHLQPQPRAALEPQTSAEDVAAVTRFDHDVWYAVGNILHRLGSAQSSPLGSELAVLNDSALGALTHDLWVGTQATTAGFSLARFDTNAHTVSAYPAGVTEIAITDPLHFQDPTADRSARGSMGLFTVQSDLGPAELEAGYSWRDPGFASIGEQKREQYDRCTLKGSVPWETGTLSLLRSTGQRREYLGRGQWQTDPVLITENRVHVDWKPGRQTVDVTLATEADRSAANRLVRRRRSYRTAVTSPFLGQHGEVSAYHERSFAEDLVQPQESVSSSETGTHIRYRLSDKLSAQTSWKVTAASSSTLDWSLKWASGYDPVRLSVTYAGSHQSFKTNITPNQHQFQDEIIVAGKGSSSKWLGLVWTPRATVSASWTDPGQNREQQTHSGDFSLQGESVRLMPRVSGSFRLDRFPSQRKQVAEADLAAGIVLWPNGTWSPGLEVNQETRRVTHATLGVQTARQTEGKLGLHYRPAPQWDDQLSASHRVERADGSETLTWEASNALHWNPSSRLGLTATVQHETRTNQGLQHVTTSKNRVGGEAALMFSDRWQGTVQGSWTGGVDETSRRYDTYTSRLEVRHSF